MALWNISNQHEEDLLSKNFSTLFQTIFTTMVNDWLYWNDYKVYTMWNLGLMLKTFERNKIELYKNIIIIIKYRANSYCAVLRYTLFIE